MGIRVPQGEKHEIPQGYRLIRNLLFPETIEAMETKTQIKREDYALMKERDEYTSVISMIQDFNGTNYEGTHLKVLKSGLSVPAPARFMPHVRDINEALNERAVLYDASGKLIEDNKLIEYARKTNTDSWVWLNAGFPKGNGFRNMDLTTITGLDEKGNLIKSIVPLEDCLDEDCWADLESLNNQGLPTRKAPIESYEPGKTFYFWKPRQGAVARWFAGSDGAVLGCDRDPTIHVGALGVFASAEGASVAKNN